MRWSCETLVLQFSVLIGAAIRVSVVNDSDQSEADRGQLSMGAAHVRWTRALLPLDWKTWRLPLAKKGRCSAPGVSDATVQEFNRRRHLRDKHSAD